jgi:hypothetical protein
MTYKEFSSVKYLGGLGEIPTKQDLTLIIDGLQRRIVFKNLFAAGSINFEDIVDVTLNEKTTRSAGKAAVGAIVGGVLTGGVGLIAGGAIGARQRDASTLYITYKRNNHPINVMLKAAGKSEEIYTAISSAISDPIPASFNYDRPKAEKQEMAKMTTGGWIVILFFVVITFLLMATCNK